MEAASSALLGRATGIVVPRLASFAKRTRQRRRVAKQALELMRIDYGHRYDFLLPYSHPFLDLERSHPDDLAAFSAVADPALSFCMERDLLEVADVLDATLERNMVLIGSPEVEAITRLAFGYRTIRGGGLEFVGDTVDLPFRWNEDPGSVRGRCLRHVQGYGVVERPNWPLMKQDASGAQPMFPEVDNDGFLATDWLLITVVPNFLTTRALDEGKRLVSIGGTHGVGTRALGIFLRDHEALSAVANGVADRHQAFQVAIEVAGIRHVPEGSYATEVRVHSVVEVSADDAAWRHAQRAVAARYTDWAIEDLNRNRPDAHQRR